MYYYSYSYYYYYYYYITYNIAVYVGLPMSQFLFHRQIYANDAGRESS